MNPRLRITLFAAVATLLGSLSLLPIYDSFGWLPRVVLAIAAVTTTSALAHRVRALALAAPLLMLAALAGVLTALYAHQVAPFGFVPGPAALRLLHQTLSDGFNDTTQLAAPVPVTPGLSLMTTGGIGLVAVVVETLATGLRRPAVAGLPLLAIFTVPAAILSSGVGWRPFVFAAAGYLALLLAEGRDRITRWGRPVRAFPEPAGPPVASPPQRPADQRQTAGFAAGRRNAVVTNQLTQVGRRVGAAAIGVAVVVPVLIPGLHSGWFGTHHTDGTGGVSTKGVGTSINPIVSLRRDLTASTPVPLFTYTTTGMPDYLRMLTLDKFDGTQWTPAAPSSGQDVKADKTLPPPANLTIKPTSSATTDISMSGLKEPYLPVPMVPKTIKAHGDWLYNPNTLVVYSKHSNTIRLNYQVASNVYSPPEAVLNSIVNDPRDPEVQPYLAVPAHLPAAIKAQADNIVAHATTAYEKAVALQNWFQNNFSYSVSARSGSDTSALVSFLQDRTGYCEQFAATMALMARMEGVPSRVDIGFTPGSKIVGTNAYVVTTADAHAWPELYFTGAGWLRFEPTPRSDGQATRPPYSTPTGVATTARPATADDPTLRPDGPGGPPTPPPSTGTSLAGGKAGDSSGWRHALADLPIGWLAVLFVVLLLGASAPGLRWWLRRRRWTAADTDAARAHAAWEELGDDLRDLRLDWRGTTESPRRAAAAVLATRRLHYNETAQQALGRLARAEELARYARTASLMGDHDLESDERAVRRALFDSVPRSRRIRARLAPASVGGVVGAAIGGISDRARDVGRRAIDGVLSKLPWR